MSQALYRKWRPARFDEIVGQEHITRTLQNSVAAGRVGHAYLFCGPRGTGKTTTARLIAKAVNCLHEDLAQRPCNACANCAAIREGRFLDLIEIDAASNTGVDDIRDLRDKINFSPGQGRYKVYIIDEVHMLSTAAFNALLKTLEEPPEHAIFVLATTEEHKVPLTIKSRCQQFNFRLLTQTEIMERLKALVQKESIVVEPQALSLIARQGAGSVRDAESLLDQLVAAPEDEITLARAQAVLGTATDTAVIKLTDAWLDKDAAGGLAVIHEALASGTDARQFCRQMVAYLRQLLLLQAAGSELAFAGTAEQKKAMAAQAQRAARRALIEAVKGFNEAALTPASGWQPQLPLELAFMELLPEQPAAAAPPATAAPASATPSPPEAEEHMLRETAVESQAKTEPPSVPSETRTEESPQETKAKQAPPKTLSLANITAHWREMINRIGDFNKNLPPLLNMSKPLAVEGNAIILGFDYPIFKGKFDDTPGAAQAIGKIFSEILDADCRVRCVVTSEYNMPISKEEFHALADELGGVVRDE